MDPKVNLRKKLVPEVELEKPKYKTEIIWFNVIFFFVFHLAFFYAMYLLLISVSWKTAVFTYIYATHGGLGTTAGMHRLWSHRSYKARLPLRILLCCFCSIAGQHDIYQWVRDHRVHHKFSGTDADPHNINRGFFFAHVGWLMCKKHPDVKNKGKNVSLDDLLADPVVRFHRRFYVPMVIFFSYALPTAIPVWCWNESVLNAFFIAGISKHIFILNFTWLVNSAAHCYGDQPYDKRIDARENALVAILANGEGWHNYHHVFPWDYSTSELGYRFNLTKVFIDFMAWIGQAYDLKTALPEMVAERKLKTGDGTVTKSLSE